MAKNQHMEKSKILRSIRLTLENNVRELENSLEAQRSASDIDEGDTRDPEDFSQQSESRDKVMALQIQLDAARAQLGKLEDLSGKKITTAEAGALVETDRNWFYMGIPLTSMKIDSKELYGVSPDSPAFNEMKGKTTGETFSIGGNVHVIMSIS